MVGVDEVVLVEEVVECFVLAETKNSKPASATNLKEIIMM